MDKFSVGESLVPKICTVSPPPGLALSAENSLKTKGSECWPIVCRRAFRCFSGMRRSNNNSASKHKCASRVCYRGHVSYDHRGLADYEREKGIIDRTHRNLKQGLPGPYHELWYKCQQAAIAETNTSDMLRRRLMLLFHVEIIVHLLQRHFRSISNSRA